MMRQNLATRKETEQALSRRWVQIEIGDICCSLACDDEEVLGSLRQLYSNFVSDRPADIGIELNVMGQLGIPLNKLASFGEEVIHSGNDAIAIYRVSVEESNTTNCKVSITSKKSYFEPRLGFKIMNQLLPPAYYGASRMKHHNGHRPMLVHSCGILRQGRVLMFAAPSETGKTTVARLCGTEHGQVINDEMLLVSRPDKGDVLKARGVPIIGGIGQRLNVEAPLSCVLLLKQSKRTALRRVDRLEAYLRFMRQVITPRDFEYRDQRTMLSQIAEFSEAVTKAVPFYELEFTLDGEPLWQAMTELEQSLGKKEG
jgi:hypothetical protein